MVKDTIVTFNQTGSQILRHSVSKTGKIRFSRIDYLMKMAQEV